MSKNIGLNDWRMMATSFEGVGGTAGEIKIADIKTDATPVTKANKNNGAQLMIQTPAGGYMSFYYLSDATDEDALQEALENNDEYLQALDNAENDVDPGEDYWWSEVDRITEEIKPTYQRPGWANGGGALQFGTIEIGTSFWYIDPNKADGLTTSGQVSTAPSIDLDMNAGWTMICNPYPSVAKYAGITWDGLVAVTKANKNNGAQLMIQTAAGGYMSFYYLSDATDEDALQEALENNDEYLQALDNAENDVDPGEDYWWSEVDRITEEIKPTYQCPGWANGGGALQTGTIVDAGLGFWLMLPAGSDPVTATFAHP